MCKLTRRKTSVVWIDAKSKLRVLPIEQKIQDDDEHHVWSQPESLLFLHLNAHYRTEGDNYVITCTDQEITIAKEKVSFFTGSIEEAIAGACVSDKPYCLKIEPVKANVVMAIADPHTDPENMSMFFDLSFESATDYDDKCGSCRLYREQAEKILSFLNDSVLIKKCHGFTPQNFNQKNLKRAIYISDTSKNSVLNWFVDTFRITFERAKIKSVIMHDIETNDHYVSDV